MCKCVGGRVEATRATKFSKNFRRCLWMDSVDRVNEALDQEVQGKRQIRARRKSDLPLASSSERSSRVTPLRWTSICRPLVVESSGIRGRVDYRGLWEFSDVASCNWLVGQGLLK